MFSSSRTRATEIADPTRLEIGDRQGQEVTEQASPELDVDAIGSMCEHISAKGSEDRFEYGDRHETNDDHVERAEAAVHQDLVDDDLKKQRRDERE